MNSKVRKIIQSFSYSFLSNLVTILVSTIIVLILPKYIGVIQYGYWQLYVFYSSYVGFLNIGWVEGIYLRYGGYIYERLDKKIFSAQFFSFIVYILSVSIGIIVFSRMFVANTDMKFILYMLALCIILSVPRGFIFYLMQSTNRIVEYSKLTLIDRIIYCFVIIGVLFFGDRDYKFLIGADLLGKGITFLYAIYICKDIIFHRFSDIKETFNEIKTNIVVGIKLMLANITSMLIIGIVRFCIERHWNIETFGKVSLTMSISNLLMTFINAIGVIMFPMLRRSSVDKLPELYKTLRTFLMIPLFFLLAIYYPLKDVFSVWLPQYSESLSYMAILFPICLYESKMAMLINTYLKTLRKEKEMLIINSMVVLISLVTSIIIIFIISSLSIAIVSIVLLLALRCILAEIYISKILTISVKKDIVLEFSMTLIFICSGWFVQGIAGFSIYFGSCLVYMIMKKRDIYNSITMTKSILRS